MDKLDFRYREVEKHLLSLVDEQVFKPGEKLPSLRTLSRRLGVSITTASQAYLELEKKGVVELVSDRIFFDPVVVPVAREAAPGGMGVLTYLVNTLKKGDLETPYSMVSAVGGFGPPNGAGEDRPRPIWSALVAPDLRNDEIVLNEWLADDLGAKVGDTIDLTYYVVGAMRALEERTSRFTVRWVNPNLETGSRRTANQARPLSNIWPATRCGRWVRDG